MFFATITGKRFIKIRDKPLFKGILVALLLLLAGAVHYASPGHALLQIVTSLVTFTLYASLLIAWGLSIHRRLLHSHIRGYLLWIDAMMLLLLLFRTWRFQPFSGIDVIARWLWYCYYIPMIFIPLLSLFVALGLGEAEDWRPSWRYNLLFIPATLLALGMLSNDGHQLAFSFGQGMHNWSNAYSHQNLFSIATVWIGALLLVMVGLLYHKSYTPYTRKRVWRPLAVIGAGAIYNILHTLNSSRAGFGFIELTVMLCALMVALWESCIVIGLIPTNTNHGAFFDAAGFGAQIIDPVGRVHYRSELTEPVADARVPSFPTGQFGEATAANYALKTAPIRGGYVVWREDISELAALARQLREAGEELKGEVLIMEKEIQAKARRLRADEKNRLYNLTVRQVKPLLEKINFLLRQAKCAPQGDRQRLLLEVNLLGAYVKRRSNLILMSEEQNIIAVGDLERCFLESVEILRGEGIRCNLDLSGIGDMYPADALLFYDLFARGVETTLSGLRGLSLNLADDGNRWRFTLELKGGAWEELVGYRPSRGQLSCTQSGDTFQLRLSLPKGGS